MMQDCENEHTQMTSVLCILQFYVSSLVERFHIISCNLEIWKFRCNAPTLVYSILSLTVRNTCKCPGAGQWEQ